ncbi:MULTISPECIES: hypothetical protein [unclassified Corynebacterium]|uniref:hypothetical protein n=1 Tax=unclassified Corynebacterium TaxID=2624378 RepID=UPI0035248424
MSDRPTAPSDHTNPGQSNESGSVPVERRSRSILPWILGIVALFVLGTLAWALLGGDDDDDNADPLAASTTSTSATIPASSVSSSPVTPTTTAIAPGSMSPAELASALGFANVNTPGDTYIGDRGTIQVTDITRGDDGDVCVVTNVVNASVNDELTFATDHVTIIDADGNETSVPAGTDFVDSTVDTDDGVVTVADGAEATVTTCVPTDADVVGVVYHADKADNTSAALVDNPVWATNL